ncbi:MAG: TIGR00730 family Rossman fold protein [Oscillospiraceae bacterium]|nr:TIGR00730 family Rossman fold protein [Oscillospiraceae bacterium]
MRICIFGASGTQLDRVYIERTQALAKKLALRGHSLIFGGGQNGLMGAAARGFTEGGGRIVGVAPRFFDVPGILYDKCDEFVYPDSMRDRKKYMEDNADAFIVVPGGIGTYEEFFEVLTLKQLARHAKPIALYNVNGFFDDVVRLIADGTKNGFIREQTISLFECSDNDDNIISVIEKGEMNIDEIKFYD